MSPRETDGGVLVDDCRGCGQETVHVGAYCSDCQVDMQVGKAPGTFFREEQAKEVEHLRSENDALHARVAELGAGETEWGVSRPRLGDVHGPVGPEHVARDYAARYVTMPAFVVKRRAPGPWVPADETGATT